MTKYEYAGKNLKDHSLWDLNIFLRDLKKAEAKREEASKHPKFNVDRELDGKKIPKMEFPPPNPKFIEIKNAIIAEIESRKNVNS